MEFVLSVAEFITTPVDGTTDNQVDIAEAVLKAYTIGSPLYWPPGSYVSSANIPYFHSVQHLGTGTITRGSDVFKISNMSGTNIIYAASTGTGVATNDGLSASQPCTLQGAMTALYNWSAQLLNPGAFRIQLAAGTYGGVNSVTGLFSQNRIQIQGPSVGASPAVPTAIIDGTGASLQNGMYFQDNMFVQVQDIKFTNWTTNSSSCGLAVQSNVDLMTINVHTSSCSYAGIDVEDRCIWRMSGGIHNNPNYVLRVYNNCTFTIGYNGSASSNRPQISGSSGGYCAIAILNGSQGHVDYCDISGVNASGGAVQLINQSRVDLNGNTFATCYYNVRCDALSTFVDNGNTFGSGTSGKSIVMYGGSISSGAQQRQFYDESTGFWRWGLTSNISPAVEWMFQDSSAGKLTYAAGVKAALESSGDTFLAFGAGPSNSGGIHFPRSNATVSPNVTPGKITYSYSDDKMHFTANGVEYLTLGGNGIGFNGVTPVAKPTVSGAKGGNAALGSLLSALSALGLVTDSTTP